MSFLLIDGNSLGYAGHNATPLHANGVQVQAIFHGLKMIRTAIKTNPDYKTPLVLWDGKPQFRYDLYPGYKDKRSSDPKKLESREAYAVQRPEIIKALDLLGIAQIHPKMFEADDVAGYLVRKSTAATKKTLMVSGDRDWLQFVNSLTSWYDPRSNGTAIIGKSEFKAFTGFANINQFIESKAIIGDASDCINGVPGLGEKAVDAIMQQFGSVANLIADYRANGPFGTRNPLDPSLSKFRKKLDALCSQRLVLSVFARNIKLMRLINGEHDEEIKKDVSVSRKPKDLDGFIDFCAHHKFASIVRAPRDWEF